MSSFNTPGNYNHNANTNGDRNNVNNDNTNDLRRQMFGKVFDSMSNIVKDTNPGVLESLHCTITEVGIVSGFRIYISMIDTNNTELFNPKFNDQNNNQLEVQIQESKNKRDIAAQQMRDFFTAFAGANKFMFQTNNEKNREKVSRAERNPNYHTNIRHKINKSDILKVENLLDDVARQGFAPIIKQVVKVHGDGNLIREMIDFKRMKKVTKVFALRLWRATNIQYLKWDVYIRKLINTFIYNLYQPLLQNEDGDQEDKKLPLIVPTVHTLNKYQEKEKANYNVKIVADPNSDKAYVIRDGLCNFLTDFFRKEKPYKDLLLQILNAKHGKLDNYNVHFRVGADGHDILSGKRRTDRVRCETAVSLTILEYGSASPSFEWEILLSNKNDTREDIFFWIHKLEQEIDNLIDNKVEVENDDGEKIYLNFTPIKQGDQPFTFCNDGGFINKSTGFTPEKKFGKRWKYRLPSSTGHTKMLLLHVDLQNKSNNEINDENNDQNNNNEENDARLLYGDDLNITSEDLLLLKLRITEMENELEAKKSLLAEKKKSLKEKLKSGNTEINIDQSKIELEEVKSLLSHHKKVSKHNKREKENVENLEAAVNNNMVCEANDGYLGALLVHPCTNVNRMASDYTRNPQKKEVSSIELKNQCNDPWHAVVTPSLNCFVKNIFQLVLEKKGKDTASKWIKHYKKCPCCDIKSIRTFEKNEITTVDIDGGDVIKMATLSPYLTSPFFKKCAHCNLDLTNMFAIENDCNGVVYYIKLFSILWHEHNITLCNDYGKRTYDGLKYFRGQLQAINEFAIALFGDTAVTPYQQLKPTHIFERLEALIKADTLFESTLSFSNLKVEMLHALRNLRARISNKFGVQPYQTIAEAEGQTLAWQMQNRDMDVETKQLAHQTDAICKWIEEQKGILRKLLKKKLLIESIKEFHNECESVNGCCNNCIIHFNSVCKRCQIVDTNDINSNVTNMLKNVKTVNDVIKCRKEVNEYLIAHPYKPTLMALDDYESYFSRPSETYCLCEGISILLNLNDSLRPRNLLLKLVLFFQFLLKHFDH